MDGIQSINDIQINFETNLNCNLNTKLDECAQESKVFMGKYGECNVKHF